MVFSRFWSLLSGKLEKKIGDNMAELEKLKAFVTAEKESSEKALSEVVDVCVDGFKKARSRLSSLENRLGTLEKSATAEADDKLVARLATVEARLKALESAKAPPPAEEKVEEQEARARVYFMTGLEQRVFETIALLQSENRGEPVKLVDLVREIFPFDKRGEKRTTVTQYVSRLCEKALCVRQKYGRHTLVNLTGEGVKAIRSKRFTSVGRALA